MDEELQSLIKDQEQLRAMRDSCMDFEKKLNEKIAKFLEKKYGLKSGDSFSVLDIIAKAEQ